MASLPHEAPPQLKASSSTGDQTTSDTAANNGESSSSQKPKNSVSFEDSKTVLFDSTSDSLQSVSTKSSSTDKEFSSNAATNGDEPRKCWICFADETEDTPLSSEWRSPCPCALTAHESCLLDWIANMEAPGSRRQTTRTGKVLCPQCKSEIGIARPRSVIVDAVRGVENVAGRMLIPGILFVSGFTVIHVLFLHGVSTIYAIFGLTHGERILEPLMVPHYRLLTGSSDSAMDILWHTLRNWRLSIGLPLIPPILVLSRTSFADHLLPIIPMLFFVASPNSEDVLDIVRWPPSPAVTFALLPYLRGAYKTLYEFVWRERERKWLREVRPAPGDGGNQEQDVQNDNAGVENDGELGVLEIGLEFGSDNEDEADEEDGDENEHDNRNENQAAQQGNEETRRPDPERIGAVPVGERFRGPAQQNGQRQDQAAPPAQAPAVRDHENAIAINIYQVADTVLGALAFPGIAAAMGEILRLVLPRSLTTAPGSVHATWWGTSFVTGRPTGLLQQRWGRSVVGGCLFIVLKDALLLYVKWKMAQLHRQRRVLDYDRKKGKEKET